MVYFFFTFLEVSKSSNKPDIIIFDDDVTQVTIKVNSFLRV